MNILDYRNTNTLWASVMIETLNRLGLTTAIICPGSRSAPLTVALAQHSSIETIPILDERSAAFFALGCAKRLHQPIALICTSGTAGANFYPAIIEAQESHIPLLIFTADRPPEMRACASGQTIDQQKLFGAFVTGYTEMAVPQTDLLHYARQTMVQSWLMAQYPKPGPVHINCPFRDPLPPLTESIEVQLDETEFFSGISPYDLSKQPTQQLSLDIWNKWNHNEQGIIIAGPAQPQHPNLYCQTISHLSQLLGWPVLADVLSPLRNDQSINPYLISTYDSLLRNQFIADQLIPQQVIQIGPLPTSKVLRAWLQQHQPRTWQLNPYALNVDPLHGKSQPVTISIEGLAQLLSSIKISEKSNHQEIVNPYCQTWIDYDLELRQKIDWCLEETQTLFEGKVSWLLSQHLPNKTPLIIANSMPIRDAESFWQPNNRQIQPYFSRGANGIDGTVSTAMGVAHGHAHSVLLTGDLAFLHDTNGLLNNRYLKGALTVILINNQGGGIFEMLPIKKFDPPFEEYFVTPQRINIASLCKAYDIQHILIQNWDDLIKQIKILSQEQKTGLNVLEFRTNRKADAQWRKTQLTALANNINHN